MSEIDIVLSFIVVGILIVVFVIALGKERINVHGCTGGGLTVEKNSKEHK